MLSSVSVIIPCYNVEKHILDCLTSITNQSYANLDIIAIDDGSTDKTLQLLKDYSKADRRLRVYSQENQGVSRTRNRGIELSKGQYLMFVDADDFIGQSYVSDLVQFSQDNAYDLVRTGFSITDHKGQFKKKVIFSDISQTLEFHAIFDTLINELYFSSASTQLIKRDLLDEGGAFDETLKIGEDFLLSLSLFNKARKIGFFASGDYFYRMHEESATHVNTTEGLINYVEDNIKIFRYASRFTNKDYLIPNRLLTKLNIASKRLVESSRNIVEFRAKSSQFWNDFSDLIEDERIVEHHLTYLNKLDVVLIRCLRRRYATTYYLICQLYFFLRRLAAK